MKTSKFIKTVLSLFITWSVIGVAYGQQAGKKIGDKITLGDYHLVPANGQAISEGKIIVLDFWATWCGPCIAGFPALKLLQSKYQYQIQVVAVSDEPLPVVSTFLKGRNMLFPIFTDPGAGLFKALNIAERPTTCILSASSELLWVGNSEEKLDVVLDEYLKTGNLKASAAFAGTDISSRQGLTANILYNYQLGLSLKNEAYSVKTQHDPEFPIDVKYTAVPVSEVVEDFLGVPGLQFINRRKDLDTICVDITANSADRSLTYRSQSAVIVQDLKKLFNFNIIEQVKTVPCYKMVIVNNAKFSLSVEKSAGGGFVKNDGNAIHITRLSLLELASYLQRKTAKFILCDDARLDKVNMVIAKIESVPALREQLLKNYGIDLVMGETKLPFYEMK